MIAGDTVSSIARRFRISADDLMKRNGIEDPTRLRVGQSLTLPAEAKIPKATPPSPAGKPLQVAAKPAPQPEAKPAPKSTATYRVQRGDTLYGIARQHKISVTDLKALNPKVENKIMVGQRLTVRGKSKGSPAPSLASSRTHVISTPSTVPAPAKQEVKKTPADKPAPVEKAEKAPKPAAATDTTKDEPKTISSIIVMEEISFGDFAEKHGTTPDQLNALNGWNFESNLVLARGSEIYVPGQ